MDSLLHVKTKQGIEALLTRPAHASAFIGQSGLGVGSLLHDVAKRLLGLSGALTVHEDRLLVVQTSESTIGIDDIRAIQHFLSLRSTGHDAINRVVIIENAERMSVEAQNALLKTIEEPPADSVLLLGVPSVQSLLPTIMSRAQALPVLKPELSATKTHLMEEFSAAEVERALVMSDGLPALAEAMLRQGQNHPLTQAAQQARTFLKATVFERLCMVDGLAKQRQESRNMCDMLARMAGVALQKSSLSTNQQHTWQKIMREATNAGQLLDGYAQPKLVLSALCLRI